MSSGSNLTSVDFLLSLILAMFTVLGITTVPRWMANAMHTCMEGKILNHHHTSNLSELCGTDLGRRDCMFFCNRLDDWVFKDNWVTILPKWPSRRSKWRVGLKEDP